MSLTEHAFPFVTLHATPANAPGRILAAVALPPFSVHVASPDVATLDDLPAAASALHDDERALARTLPSARQAAFIAGRVALRAAVSAVAPELSHTPMLRTTRGAPSLPSGVAGSVSHKRQVAVAISSGTDDHPHTLGVDVEDLPQDVDSRRPDISSRILTARERDAIVSLDPLAYRRATIIRFAIKEAVYKAIDPHVQRYVGFTEVEVDVSNDGSAEVTLLLPELRGHAMAVRAAWWIQGEHVLATAVSVLR